MKHELKCSKRPRYQVVTGSSSYYIWELSDLKKIKSISYSGGWQWWRIFNILKKKIPILDAPHNEQNKYYYNFKELYYLREFAGKKNAYRYDINKAYRSILEPLLLSYLDTKELNYIYDLKNKKHFNHAVGYCGFHKQVIDLQTAELIQETLPPRADILAFCTNYLKELGTAFRKEFGAYFFQFVDAFSFDYSQSMRELEAFSNLILTNYYQKNNLSEVIKKNRANIIYKKDVFDVERNGINLTFHNEIESKNYMFIRK